MATKLSFCSSHDFSISINKFTIPQQRIHRLSLFPYSLNSNSFCFSKSMLIGRGGPSLLSHAVKEEGIRTSDSAENQSLDSNPSSSKLVLVIGGTGGVGMQPFSFPCCSCINSCSPYNFFSYLLSFLFQIRSVVSNFSFIFHIEVKIL